ncbi:30-kDa cleavage and polyadenylation specificity factor 30-like [Selaginella moellendorffii]|uniref:30-kDa cleavage and polyadenylation specificity factor 30-like n=1 Tax=Selaginella moellendorffii TaxID=88036 RepID=UPI000D1C6742|nr:30-kDa cleavage and polyadenylation specificity factor 30-like [Selaginella moellendorffii]|eukprot:XP_024536963.1 30-kDa cleavage and polyadenylation specificity factor 30-like [Selaginella moellendorffii]
MDDDGGLNFDFEGGLDAVTAASGQAPPPQAMGGLGGGAAQGQGMSMAPRGPVRRSFRQTVCRHWLRGLCMKGNDCGFLHQYDKSRMPLCRFFARFGECREPDCIYKHSTEDIKECNMYKLGFCPNGPECRYRHEKLPGPPPPVEQHLSKFRYQPHQKQQQQHMNSDTPPLRPPMMQQQGGYDHQNGGPNGGKPRKMMSASNPLPYGFSRFAAQSRYFIVKSSNRENLELSVRRGVWATHRNNEAKLNEALESCEHVILIFSVNETRHFQGCARMMSKAGGAAHGTAGWKQSHGMGSYGRNFRLKWLKLCELSFHKTRHLHNPYNENLPVKISRDCQEVEPSVGQELAELLYLELDSNLMAVANESEAEREEAPPDAEEHHETLEMGRFGALPPPFPAAFMGYGRPPMFLPPLPPAPLLQQMWRPSEKEASGELSEDEAPGRSEDENRKRKRIDN